MSLETAVDEVIKLSDQVQRLRVENARLRALAKLGRWCLDTSKDQDIVYVAGEENILDKAEELGLLKILGCKDHVTVTETDLAKLPETE